MPTSDAVKRAKEKYNKEKTKLVALRFTKASDQDIIDFIEAQPNKLETFRKAIRLLIETEK